MILVCGSLADPVTELVCARLLACSYPYRLLDLRSFPADHAVRWQWSRSGVNGHIAAPGWRLDLSDITGVFARYPGHDRRRAPAGAAPDTHAAIFNEVDAGLMTLIEHLPCTVVNRLAGGMSNHSKTYQALLVRRCGLLTPPTLVTNDAVAVRAFQASSGGDVIYKSLSGIRSIVKRLDEAQLERLPFLHHGPAQFQAFVPGENVRVHVVGDRLFATRVVSDDVDYRYPSPGGRDVEMEPFELPDAVAASCRLLAERLDLVLAGIDLKVTPEGHYYCFEVNPCPGFLYYERGGGQPISEALAHLLHANACPARPQVAVRSRMDRRASIPAGSTL